MWKISKYSHSYIMYKVFWKFIPRMFDMQGILQYKNMQLFGKYLKTQIFI